MHAFEIVAGSDLRVDDYSYLPTEKGTCYDETVKCSQFAADGRCYSRDEPYRHHSNYCLRSCGMCGTTSTTPFLPRVATESARYATTILLPFVLRGNRGWLITSSLTAVSRKGSEYFAR